MPNDLELEWFKKLIPYAAISLMGGVASLAGEKAAFTSLRRIVSVVVRSMFVGIFSGAFLLDYNWSQGWKVAAVCLMSFGADYFLDGVKKLFERFKSNPITVIKDLTKKD